MTIRVLIADDHPVVRSGLAGMLAVEPDVEVVGEAADGAAAVSMARSLTPDLVLMDLRMPVLDGAAATAQITEDLPDVHVLILTTYETDTDILRAVEAGATGYLLKDTPRDQLVAGVRAAARGESALSPSVARRLVQQLRSDADRLTARELEVLSGVARDLSNAAIGRELYITEATLKTHLLRVFGKLGVDDRTHAMTVAIQRGILPGL